MKTSKTFPLLTVLVLSMTILTLASCSSVFDAAVGGSVVDDTTGDAISDVAVFVYQSESDRDAAYARYSGEAEFKDSSVPSQKTDANGSFSIPTVRWMTNNPAFGKDADKLVIYLLFFSKEYGLVKSNEGYLIQSEKSNTIGTPFRLKKVMETKTLTINFKDNDSTGNVQANISDTSAFSYSYSYNDGYEAKVFDNVVPAEGQSVLNISYKISSGTPTVTIQNLDPGSGWEYVGNQPIAVDLGSTREKSLYFTNQWLSKTLTINLKDGSVSSKDAITDRMEFKYSYNDGETTRSDTLASTSGDVTLTVRYRADINADKKTEVVLSAFDSTNNIWIKTAGTDDGTPDANGVTVTVTDSKSSYTQDVYFKRNKMNFPGISGYITDGTSTSSSVKGTVADDGRRVGLFGDEGRTKSYGHVITTTSSQDKPADSEPDHGYFSSLGAGTEIIFSYPAATGDNGNALYTSDSVSLYLVYYKDYTDGNAVGAKTIDINNKTKAEQLTNLVIQIDSGSGSRSLMRAESSNDAISLLGE